MHLNCSSQNVDVCAIEGSSVHPSFIKGNGESNWKVSFLDTSYKLSGRSTQGTLEIKEYGTWYIFC